ncbi:DUF2695 domain-containing protein [Paeniglutamicibacter sp. ORCA_105]|jgi:hypothetical protein|uniref:DUF2695 domain-containing protein n=1 Tax=Paeniglutamicibacter sp. ORCA_105 TaxID=3377336 RepID=UPI003895E427
MDQYTVSELEDALKVVKMLLPPRYECLACYVNRMLEHGCSGLKWCTTYRDLRAPRATSLERKFPELGGCCDCEVMANVFRINDELWIRGDDGEIDDSYVPPCHKVRLGTIRPCELWLMRSGVQWGGGVFRPVKNAS